MITACLDHCVVSGMASGDLGIVEMSAIQSLKKAVDDGRLQIATSQEVGANRGERRTRSAQGWSRRDLSRLSKKMKNFSECTVTEIGSPGLAIHYSPSMWIFELFENLKKAGLKEADARHLMYAVHNKCDRFVTTDRDFLRRRSQLTSLCGNTRIVRPSELAAELLGLVRVAGPSATRSPPR